jgi:hypothetical protein
MKTIQHPLARILKLEINKSLLLYNLLSKDNKFDDYNFYYIYFELYQFKKFLKDL